jgi:hypothetical protein
MQFSDVLVLASLAISALFSLVAITVSFLVARRQNELATKDLTLTAYSHAVQEILNMKDMFAERHEVFQKQVDLTPKLQVLIPDDMDSLTFLTLTSNFWRFSYIYSVMVRWKELGLTRAERQALEGEMRAWLENVPGFRQVYKSFVVKANHHNPEFMDWLKKVYSSGSTDTHMLSYSVNPFPHGKFISILGSGEEAFGKYGFRGALRCFSVVNLLPHGNNFPTRIWYSCSVLPTFFPFETF